MKFVKLLDKTSAAFERIGYMWLWLLISFLLLAPIASINPMLVSSYAWTASKISLAAAIGYGVDWAAFRGGDPRIYEGIEKSMAQTRRVTLLAAAIIGAGLIG